MHRLRLLLKRLDNGSSYWNKRETGIERQRHERENQVSGYGSAFDPRGIPGLVLVKLPPTSTFFGFCLYLLIIKEADKNMFTFFS